MESFRVKLFGSYDSKFGCFLSHLFRLFLKFFIDRELTICLGKLFQIETTRLVKK